MPSRKLCTILKRLEMLDIFSHSVSSSCQVRNIYFVHNLILIFWPFVIVFQAHCCLKRAYFSTSFDCNESDRQIWVLNMTALLIGAICCTYPANNITKCMTYRWSCSLVLFIINIWTFKSQLSTDPSTYCDSCLFTGIKTVQYKYIWLFWIHNKHLWSGVKAVYLVLEVFSGPQNA